MKESATADGLRDLADRMDSGELTVTCVEIEHPEKDGTGRVRVDYMNADDYAAMMKVFAEDAS